MSITLVLWSPPPTSSSRRPSESRRCDRSDFTSNRLVARVLTLGTSHLVIFEVCLVFCPSSVPSTCSPFVLSAYVCAELLCWRARLSSWRSHPRDEEKAIRCDTKETAPQNTLPVCSRAVLLCHGFVRRGNLSTPILPPSLSCKAAAVGTLLLFAELKCFCTGICFELRCILCSLWCIP